jgi:hypothetical protein
MAPDDHYAALSNLILTVLREVTEATLLLPSLSPPDCAVLTTIYLSLLSLERLFPSNRINEFMPFWTHYKIIPQLLELDALGILALWRNGKLRAAKWDAMDTIELVNRRFGRTAEKIVKEIRRTA